MSMKSGVMPGGDAPAFNASVIAPLDATLLLPAARALWIGGAGNLSVVMAGDDSNNTIVFVGVPAGVWMPIQVKRVMTATTATSIVAVY